jgi:hypothetical protein
LVAEIRIKRSVVKIMHNSFVIFFEDLARWECTSVPRDIQETTCNEQQILFK